MPRARLLSPLVALRRRNSGLASCTDCHKRGLLSACSMQGGLAMLTLLGRRRRMLLLDSRNAGRDGHTVRQELGNVWVDLVDALRGAAGALSGPLGDAYNVSNCGAGSRAPGCGPGLGVPVRGRLEPLGRTGYGCACHF